MLPLTTIIALCTCELYL